LAPRAAKSRSVRTRNWLSRHSGDRGGQRHAILSTTGC